MSDSIDDECVEVTGPKLAACGPRIEDAAPDLRLECFSEIEEQLRDPNVVLIVGTTMVRRWCRTGTYVLTRCVK